MRTEGHYGIDEPRWPLALGGAGGACLAGALVAVRPGSRWTGLPLGALIGGLGFLGSACSYLYTTRWGKFAVWCELLRELDLRGDERLLDMGCGRGAVLLMAAQMVPRGQALGIDLWNGAEQSGNSPAATWHNAVLEGVADRVRLHTGDMTALPLGDASVDLVVSSLAIHNISSREGRIRALDEAVRVLKPAGRLAIADIHYVTDDYVHHLGELGMTDITLRDLGWRFWYGGPWAATKLVTASKPRAGSNIQRQTPPNPRPALGRPERSTDRQSEPANANDVSSSFLERS